MKFMKLVSAFALSTSMLVSVGATADNVSAKTVTKTTHPAYTTTAVAYDKYSEKGFSKKVATKKTWYLETQKVSIKSGYILDAKTGKKVTKAKENLEMLRYYDLSVKNGKLYQKNKLYSGEFMFGISSTGNKEYYYRAYKGKVIKVSTKAFSYKFGL